MNCKQVQELLSAIVDRDYTGLTKREIVELHRLIRNCPECFRELQLDIATKHCVTKHTSIAPCPDHLAAHISSAIKMLYSSFRTSEQI